MSTLHQLKARVAPSSAPRRRPSAQRSLFARMRLRLVGWNLAVLCAILVVVAAAVYVSQSRALAAQVDAQLISQSDRELASGRAVEDLAEAAKGAAATGASGSPGAEEASEPYEADVSPNLFSLLLDAQGHLVRRPGDVHAAGLPDLTAAWPVLRGTTSSTLVTVETSSRGAKQTFRLYTVPVRRNGQIVGVLQVGTSLAPRYAELGTFLQLLAVMGGLGLFLAAAGSLFLAGRALVPVQETFDRQRAFVGDASHELRTPLSLMRAEAELLVRSLPSAARGGASAPAASSAGPPVAAQAERSAVAPAGTPSASEGAEALELARDLMTEIDYMSHLVEALLQLARMDSGAEPLHRQLVDLAALAERTCRFAQPLAAERGLHLSCDITGGAPMAVPAHEASDGAERAADTGATGHVWGDPDRLRQILLILLDNALRYTSAGGTVCVSGWQEPGTSRHSGQIIIQVTDTGPGIAPEHLPHLFDRFYRVDKARSRELGGSGLGLAIADGLARAHGGAVTVESTLGVGTSFRLIVPLAPLV
jgi:signal transduction histidine kinase